MDEFSIFIDSDLFSNQNPESLWLCSSSEEKPVFDVVLSALSDGTFLPPLLFFRGGPSRVPDGFPENVLLEARQDGFTDQERLQIWINKVGISSRTRRLGTVSQVLVKGLGLAVSRTQWDCPLCVQVWRPRVVASASLLVVDVHRGHQSKQLRDSLSSVLSDVVFIPSGCSCRLQPLDVCVTPVLRDFLQVLSPVFHCLNESLCFCLWCVDVLVVLCRPGGLSWCHRAVWTVWAWTSWL